MMSTFAAESLGSVQTRSRCSWPAVCSAIGLLALFAILAIVSMRQKSVTVDEIMYIAAGHYHLTTGDFYLNMTNPPLTKMLSALPLILMGVSSPPTQDSPRDWSLIQQWQYARSFLYDNVVDADRMLFWARVPTVILGIILGWLVFSWSFDLFGPQAALVALGLYCFSPNILAHTRLAALDLGLTLFMFAATYAFWRFMRSGGTWTLLLTGALCGCALLTKTTAVFLAPIFALYTIVCIACANGFGILNKWPLVRRIGKQATRKRQFISALFACGTIAVVVVLVLAAGYAFAGSFAPLDADGGGEAAQRLPAGIRWAVGLVASLPRVIPEPFLELVRFQRRLTESSGGTFLWGRVFESGVWYSMLATFGLKVPVAGILLFVASVVLWAVGKNGGADLWLLYGAVVIVLGLFSYMSNVNVGFRYVLPMLPFMHVCAASLWRRGLIRARVPQVAGVVLVLWYISGAARVHPHYLAHFNEIAGGPSNGYRVLVDSNLDWGQDLKSLGEYMRENGIDTIKLGYFGSADASYYGINYEYLPSVGLAPKKAGQRWWYEANVDHPFELAPQRGWIAVSATLRATPGWLRNMFGNSYVWLRNVEPVDQVGHSILVYHID